MDTSRPEMCVGAVWKVAARKIVAERVEPHIPSGVPGIRPTS